MKYRQSLFWDTKPENILVTHSGNVRLIDFDLARPIPETPKKMSKNPGTPGYMAPEQFQRLPLDHRTDLYSLGCIFYEALTGHPAYDGDNIAALIDAHLKSTPFPMKQLRKDISPKLDHWVMRFLEKDPAHRTPSAVGALRTLPTLDECRLDPRRSSSSLLGKFVQRSPAD